MNVIDVRRVVDGLAAEVMNGGFHQYFFNSTGDEAAAALHALEAIRADRTAALLREACSKFPGGMPSSDWFQRRDDLDRVDPDIERFEALDNAFYGYTEDLDALVDAYERLADT